jgi:hypothetical protein
MVYAVIMKTNTQTLVFDSMRNDFGFDFVIRETISPNYSYRIFSFSYDISMYTVRASLNKDIAKSLSYEDIYIW